MPRPQGAGAADEALINCGRRTFATPRSLSGTWKRSAVLQVKSEPTKKPATDSHYLTHRRHFPILDEGRNRCLANKAKCITFDLKQINDRNQRGPFFRGRFVAKSP